LTSTSAIFVTSITLAALTRQFSGSSAVAPSDLARRMNVALGGRLVPRARSPSTTSFRDALSGIGYSPPFMATPSPAYFLRSAGE